MKIVKQCTYCSTVYNLLPCVLLTPLYSMTQYETPVPAARMCVPLSEYHKDMVIRPKDYWMRRGFRLALKFWCWHLGWEVHYDTK